jgi:hypothetical protein
MSEEEPMPRIETTQITSLFDEPVKKDKKKKKEKVK